MYDPSVWLGTYSIQSGCDQSTCCCAQTSTITDSNDGSTYTITGSNLAGQCGSSPPSSVTAKATKPTSNTVTYSVDGESHTATRSDDGNTLYDSNASSAACSAYLVKSSSITSSSMATASASSGLLAALMVVAWVVLKHSL